MKKINLILLVITVLVVRGYSNDSLSVNNFNSIKILRFENPWLNTGNVAGLVFNSNDLILFDVGVHSADRDFKRMREAKDISTYSVSTSSYKKLNDQLYTSGAFSYNNTDETGSRWNGVYDPYNGNPYIIGDSVTGVETHRENYQLKGELAYKVSNKWILGTGVNYFVAVAAKQKDPRPSNIVTKFEFHPSAILNLKNSKIGFDIGYYNRKEEIDYETLRSNISTTYFMFKGFGFYSIEIPSGTLKRFMYEKNFSGGVQYEKELFGMKSLTELRTNVSLQRAEDGSTIISKKDGGDWNTYDISLSQKFEKINGNNFHVFSAKFDFYNGDGKEYIQEKVTEGDHTEYVTQSIKLKMNRMTFGGELSYDYYKMINRNTINYESQLSVGMKSNMEEYYYIPEVFSSDYSSLFSELYFQKNFYTNKLHLAPALTTTYLYNLNQSILLSNDSQITGTQITEIYMHDFEYYSSDLVKIKACMQIGYKPKSSIGIKQIDLYLMADYWKPTGLDTKQMNYCAKLGFVF